MATSTLIQFLNAGQTADTMNRRQVETFIANGAIAAGDWVQLDNSKTDADRTLFVKEAAATADGNALVIGVATEAAAAGDQVRVVVSGYAEGASVDNAVNAAGLALVVDNTAAGKANAIAASDKAPACGVSLEAASGHLCDVWVFKRF